MNRKSNKFNISRFVTPIVVVTSFAISVTYCFVNGIPGQHLIPAIPGLIWKIVVASAFVVTIYEVIIIGVAIGGFAFVFCLYAYINRVNTH